MRLLKTIILALLLLAVKGQEEVIGADGDEICSCSPTIFEFTFVFDSLCPGNFVADDSDAIEEITCDQIVLGPDQTNIQPALIQSVTILELNEFAVINQTITEGPFDNGDSIEYASISSYRNLTESYFPYELILTVTGQNSDGTTVVNAIGVNYETSECDTWPVFPPGATIGWVQFGTIQDAFQLYCPAAPMIPSATPSMAPVIETTTTVAPVIATTTTAPPVLVPTISTTTAPPILVPTFATTTAPPVLVPTLAPPTTPPPNVAPVVPTVGPPTFAPPTDGPDPPSPTPDPPSPTPDPPSPTPRPPTRNPTPRPTRRPTPRPTPAPPSPTPDPPSPTPDPPSPTPDPPSPTPDPPSPTPRPPSPTPDPPSPTPDPPSPTPDPPSPTPDPPSPTMGPPSPTQGPPSPTPDPPSPTMGPPSPTQGPPSPTPDPPSPTMGPPTQTPNDFARLSVKYDPGDGDVIPRSCYLFYEIEGEENAPVFVLFDDDEISVDGNRVKCSKKRYPPREGVTLPVDVDVPIEDAFWVGETVVGASVKWGLPSWSETDNERLDVLIVKEPSEGPEPTCDEIVDTVIMDASTNPEGLLDPTSSQAKALEWLKSEANCETDYRFHWIQAYALAAVYYESGGPDTWVSKDGWPGTPGANRNVCTPTPWEFVTCNGNVVITFEPDMNNLVGELHPEIGLLRYLEVLNVKVNNLGGEIPEEVTRLENLSLADFRYNDFEGSVPEGLCDIIGDPDFLLVDSNVECPDDCCADWT